MATYKTGWGQTIDMMILSEGAMAPLTTAQLYMKLFYHTFETLVRTEAVSESIWHIFCSTIRNEGSDTLSKRLQSQLRRILLAGPERGAGSNPAGIERNFFW